MTIGAADGPDRPDRPDRPPHRRGGGACDHAVGAGAACSGPASEEAASEAAASAGHVHGVADPRRVWAATPQGLAESLDGGRSFQLTTSDASTGPPLVFLDAVPAPHGDREPDLVGVDATGGMWGRFRDGWRATGELGSPPTTWSATGSDRYLSATTTAVVSSEDAGRTWVPLAPVA